MGGGLSIVANNVVWTAFYLFIFLPKIAVISSEQKLSVNRQFDELHIENKPPNHTFTHRASDVHRNDI